MRFSAKEVIFNYPLHRLYSTSFTITLITFKVQIDTSEIDIFVTFLGVDNTSEIQSVSTAIIDTGSPCHHSNVRNDWSPANTITVGKKVTVHAITEQDENRATREGLDNAKQQTEQAKNGDINETTNAENDKERCKEHLNGSSMLTPSASPPVIDQHSDQTAKAKRISICLEGVPICETVLEMDNKEREDLHAAKKNIDFQENPDTMMKEQSHTIVRNSLAEAVRTIESDDPDTGDSSSFLGLPTPSTLEDEKLAMMELCTKEQSP